MSMRLFAFRLAAAFLFTGVALGAAPAIAQQSPHWGCGTCGTTYVVPQPRYHYSTGCGGCGAQYVAPQPQYYHSSSCGCGGGSYYAQPSFVQQQYYVRHAAIPAYAPEEFVEPAVVEPEFEQSPVYYEGQRIYRGAGVARRIDYRVNRRIDRRVDRRVERRADRRIERRGRR